VTAGRELHRQLPFAERIFAEVLAELGRRPGLAAIGRDRDFLDALPPSKAIPLSDVVPAFSFAPSATLVMKERTSKRLIGIVAFGAVPGSTQAHGVSGIR
jgi:hypothetical protein